MSIQYCSIPFASHAGCTHMRLDVEKQIALCVCSVDCPNKNEGEVIEFGTFSAGQTGYDIGVLREILDMNLQGTFKLFMEKKNASR